MIKVVYNACFGGYGLSELALKRYRDKTGEPVFFEEDMDTGRHDPVLVEIVEELGELANDSCANLKVIEVEGKYRITEYDGFETVETPESIDWVEVSNNGQ